MRLSQLLCCAFFLAPSCQEEKKAATKPVETEKVEKPKQKSLLSVPAGAKISLLNLPYYDDNQKKISQLVIKELVVADNSETGGLILEGQDLTLWLFDDEGSIRSTTKISRADYFLEEEKLVARDEVVTIGANKQFAIKSMGGIFSLETGQAILLGPATSQFKLPEKKTP